MIAIAISMVNLCTPVVRRVVAFSWKSDGARRAGVGCHSGGGNNGCMFWTSQALSCKRVAVPPITSRYELLSPLRLNESRAIKRDAIRETERLKIHENESIEIEGKLW